LRAAVWGAVAGRADTCRVRLRLDSAGAVTADAEPLTAAPATTELAIVDRAVLSDDVLLFHKHDDRRRYDELRRSRPDVDDVLLVNERGQVTESTRANLAALSRGRWWTPPLDSGLLPGIERGRLLETGELAERVLTPDDVASADALALISSLRGWRPARLKVSGRDATQAVSAGSWPQLDRTRQDEVG
jgi:para-aminobenzoate synthetase/4-amino-4-deoxychorismate lyase